MKDFSEIVGNKRLCEKISKNIREGNLPHAIIIEGAFGTGKHTIALNIAAALSCENKKDAIPCGFCKNCRKILSGKSPDVIYVKKEDGKTQMSVDIIRELRRDVALLPNDLEEKVYIIEDAHLMNVQSQNAFLLTLEEPPKFVRFILICETATSLLETVRSRSQLYRTELLTNESIEAFLKEKSSEAKALLDSNSSDFDDIVMSSGGSIGRALTLLNEKERKPIIENRSLAEKFLRELLNGRKGKGAFEIINAFSQKREEIALQLTDIQYAVRDLLVIKKAENAPLCFFKDRDIAYELSAKYKGTTLMKLYNSLDGAKEKLERNANIRLTLFSLASECSII